MSDTGSRHQLFQYARHRADWSIQQLWLGYLALGGTGDAFDIEAFVHGLGSLSNPEQDVLANAVNERLDDLYLAARIPYLSTFTLPPHTYPDPLTLIDQMLKPPDEQTPP